MSDALSLLKIKNAVKGPKNEKTPRIGPLNAIYLHS